MAYLKLNTSTGNTGLVSVTLNHCNQPFVFLIDTGSNISHIDKSFLDIFPEKNSYNLMIKTLLVYQVKLKV